MPTKSAISHVEKSIKVRTGSFQFGTELTVCVRQRRVSYGMSFV